MSIKLEHVTYTYSPGTAYEMHALDDVSLEIPQGQFVGVIGHTGSGKSTLIQHFNALMQPTKGTVYFNGEDVWAEKYDRRQLRFHVGLVFQYPEYQLFETDVLTDVMFGPKNQGLSPAEQEQRAREALEQVGVPENFYRKSPFDLSGGQKRRVAIAGVLAMNPDVLVLDEPTAGLDPAGRDQIFAQIKKYHERNKNTILIVSHSMEDIASFADRILVMNQGKLFCFDETVKVFARAEEIVKIGLDVPQITKVFLELKRRGLDFGKEVYTVDYAKELLLRHLKERGGL